MILSSPSKDLDQAPPVTTTFDAPDSVRRRITRRPRAARPERIDWDRVEGLHAFVRDRTTERLREAEHLGDLTVALSERANLHAIDAMFEQARQRHGVVAACAITFFRARAMRDAHHAEFLGEWLGTTVPARQVRSLL